jgi:EmrB/QacA subfamily drug resistance transporter
MGTGTLTAQRPATDGRTSGVALRSSTGAALIAATVLATAVCFLDASVVNVAVPAIGRSFGASVSALQWTLTSFLLAVGGLLLLAGALADTFGRRRIVSVGLLVMGVGSIFCAAAPSVDMLIAARVVQGVGAALVVPTSLALLNGTLDVRDRARGIGIWAGLATIATTVGPYVGGWLVDHASWRWVFLLNLPLIAAALLVLARVPESVDRRPLPADLLGALLTVIGLVGVIYALTEGAASGWSHANVITALVVGLTALGSLVPIERRVPEPMLRLSLFASRQFDAINATTLLYYGALAAAGYLVVIEFQLQLGYSASQAGAALIPSSVVFLILSPLSGGLVLRIGPRVPMVAGILAAAVAFAWLSQIHAGAGYVDSVLPGVLLYGVALGLSVTPLTAAVLAAVPDSDLGEASAVNDDASRVGAAIAVALVPLLIGATGGKTLTQALGHGFETGMLVVAGLSVAAALVTAVFVSDDHVGVPTIAPHPLHHACALPVPDEQS